MAKKKAYNADKPLPMIAERTPNPPPEDSIPLEVLPGILIEVHPDQSFMDEDEIKIFNKLTWPIIAAVDVMVDDLIYPNEKLNVVARVRSRGHRITANGPVLMLTVYTIIDE